MDGRKNKDSRSKLERLRNMWRGRSPSTSRKRGINTPDQLVVTSSSQSLAVQASVPARPDSYSGSSALQAQGSSHYDSPPTAAGVVVTTVPLGGHGSPSSSMSSGAPFVPTSDPPSPSNSTPDQPTQSLAVHSSYSNSSAPQTHRPSLHDLSLPTDAGGSPSSGARGSSTISVSVPIFQMSYSQASAEIAMQAAAPPQTKSVSLVWAKALELAEKKLNEKNLPPLNFMNLTLQSAEKNIEAVIKALNTLQEDERKKRWSYTWRGKEVVVVERLGKILKNVEKYSEVVDIAIQTNPQVSALLWAGVWAIMRKQSKALR
ncbi:hypothetical protein BGX38DRAFT_247943 [Terfezia claveryi]|nr:hypothetical protein BGX38DRAFT_247943 [Terfezia claveryi]